MTIFDLPAHQAAADLAQWAPILDWLSPLLYPVQAANDPTPLREPASTRVGASRPQNLMPAQESLVHGGRLSMFTPSRPAAAPVAAPVRAALPRAESTGGPHIPQFLKRGA